MNIYVISPPYNALFLAQLYKEPDKYKAIEDIKRYIVKEVGVIYEMSYINKYTKFILTNKDNTFYPDVAHPDYVFGREFYMYLTNSDKKNVFIKKADKNNIEEILKWERKLLAQYEKDNKDYINNYLKYADERERYFNEFITITKELP